VIHHWLKRWMRHHHPHRPQRRPRYIRVWFTLNNSSILLDPEKEIFVMSDIRADQTGAMAVEAVDVFGNAVPATIDSVVWTNSNDAAATVAASGNTATITPVAGAVGQSTTVTAVATIGATSFTATADFTVTSAAVAGVRIVTALTPP